MARSGQFAGPSEGYAEPLSYVHPPDSDFMKSKYHPSLLDPKLKLTDEERDRLQAEIDDLLGTSKLTEQLPL